MLSPSFHFTGFPVEFPPFSSAPRLNLPPRACPKLVSKPLKTRRIRQ